MYLIKNESFYRSLINHFDSEMSQSPEGEGLIYNAVNVFLYVDIASCIYAVTGLPPRVYVVRPVAGLYLYCFLLILVRLVLVAWLPLRVNVL